MRKTECVFLRFTFYVLLTFYVFTFYELQQTHVPLVIFSHPQSEKRSLPAAG
jgi:hypothetical protein